MYVGNLLYYDSTNIKKYIIKEYYEQLYTNKLDNLEKMDGKISRIHKLLKLSQEEINNLNIPVTSKEIKLAMKKKIPTKEIPGPDGFTTEFYQTFIE